MDLDDLTDMIEGKGSKERVFAGDDMNESDSESPDEIHAVSHLIDDDEQEQSDLEDEIEDGSDGDDSQDEQDIVSDGELRADEELNTDDSDFQREDDDDDEGESEEENDGQESGEEENDSAHQDYNFDNEEDENCSKDEDEDGDDDEEAELQREKEKDTLSHAYQPSKGEDIYGRLISAPDGTNVPGSKYVPPGKRAHLLATIDEVRIFHRIWLPVFNPSYLFICSCRCVFICLCA